MASKGRTGASAKDHGSPEIEENMAVQRRTWVAERVGWVVMGLLVLAALAGLFAKGPLSSAEARDAEGLLAVTYDRFLRYRAPATIRLDLAAAAVTGDRVSIRVDDAFLSSFGIQEIAPEPSGMALDGAAAVLDFDVAARGRPVTIRFSVMPERVGPTRAEIALAGAAPVRFATFTYP